jgi:hypothetical protein
MEICITKKRTQLCWPNKSVDVAIPTSHKLHCTVSEKLQKYADLKEELIRMWQLKTAHTIPPVLSTAVLTQTDYR